MKIDHFQVVPWDFGVILLLLISTSTVCAAVVKRTVAHIFLPPYFFRHHLLCHINHSISVQPVFAFQWTCLFLVEVTP